MKKVLAKPSSASKVEELSRDNWFWCDLCERVAYDYSCECYGTSCNGGGCPKCKHLWTLVPLAKKLGMSPDEQELRARCEANGGTAENKLLKEIFGE